ncbi:MAG: hypothetical protein B7X34_00060, partial [Acidobacteriia bacterium 12-62-4]
GPVVIPKLYNGKDKTFFFFNYEGLRRISPFNNQSTIPTEAVRQGNFSGNPVSLFDSVGNVPFPNNQIPANRIDPVARRVMAFMPTPNNIEPGQRYSTTNFIQPTYVNQDDFYNLILKFDWNFGDKHRSFIRHASNDRTEERCANGICSGPGMDGQQPFQRIPPRPA